MVNKLNIQYISEVTGFDNGDMFTSAGQVREYFNRESLAGAILDNDIVNQLPSQYELGNMAEAVIAHKWHCSF